MWQRWIALLYIQDSDFRRSFRVIADPAFYNFPGSIGSFSWHATATVLVGSMFHDCPEHQNKRMMDALIREEARHCDDAFLFLNAIVNLSDVIRMRDPAFCDQDFLQFSRMLIDVLQNSSD